MTDEPHTERELETEVLMEGIEVRDVKTGVELRIPYSEIEEWTDEDLRKQVYGTMKHNDSLMAILTQEVLETWYELFDTGHNGWPVGLQE